MVSVKVPVPDFVKVAPLPERIAPTVISPLLLKLKVVPVNTPVVLRMAPEVRLKLPIDKLVVPKSKVPPAIVTSPPTGKAPEPESAIVPALIVVPPVKVLAA